MKLKKGYQRNVFLVVCCLLWGLFAHGVALFNKFSFNDDAFFLYDVGYTYTLGRWALGILAKIIKIFFGTTHYSLPLINGVLTILFISVTIWLIVDLYDFDNVLVVVVLSGLLIVFPSVTGIMGFMFTAPYYYFGIMLGCVGQYILIKKDNLLSIIICILCLSFSFGIYQANIPFHISFFLLEIFNTIKKTEDGLKSYLKKGIKYCVVLLLSVLLYFLINLLVLNVLNVEMFSDRRGLNDYGYTSISGYLDRIILAYSEFISPKNNHSRNTYPFSILYIYYLVLVVFVFAIIIYLRSNKEKIMQTILTVVLLPLSTNFIFVMTDDIAIHGLMTYGKTMLFVIFIWYLDKCLECNDFSKVIKKVGFILIFIINIMYVRFSNTCYLKAALQQSQTISYFNTLITQIKSVEDYVNDAPVVYVNEFKIKDDSFVVLDEFDSLYLHPYRYKNLINNYAWKEFMKNWCGFDPVVIDQYEFQHIEEINNMPCYPDAGSIKMIDGVVVVKFAESE